MKIRDFIYLENGFMKTGDHEIKSVYPGQAWGLTHVIPVLWEVEAGGSPEVESSKPAISNMEKPHLT